MKTPILVLVLVITGQCWAADYQYNNFTKEFLFGVATAAHQIEGAWNLGGKSENVWDRLSHSRPELIADGTTGDIAVDSYHRYKEDVEELSYLGVQVYRLSLSWARILPTGRVDFINIEGINYYIKLIDLLLENKIQPMVTLFHWDMPQTLMDLGGWANPNMVDYFKDYSDLCYRTFGEKVKLWITFNEPYEICEDGYGDQKKAPAIRSHGVGNYLCGDTLLKAHAESYHLYDTKFRPTQNGRIMISINSIWYAPLDPANPTDVALAVVANQFKFGWFGHPIYSKDGDYPQAMKDQVYANSLREGLPRSRLPVMSADWIDRIKGTADILGINHYTTHLVTSGVDPSAQEPSWLKDIGAKVSLNIGESSASEWLRVYPKGFGDMLRWADKEYNHPEIMITENGVSDKGGLVDDARIKYFKDYLAELLIAMYDDKVNITGYVAWTLMDNFEWRAGFSERFGLYAVDITNSSLPRTAKKSAAFFKKMIEDRSISGAESVNFHVSIAIASVALGMLWRY